MDGGPGISRRGFTKAAAATGAVVAATGGGLIWVMSDGGDPVAFTVDHGDDVYVWMGSGSPFTVRVHRADGTVLESFDDVTASTVTSIESAHVRIREVAVPTPA